MKNKKNYTCPYDKTINCTMEKPCVNCEHFNGDEGCSCQNFEYIKDTWTGYQIGKIFEFDRCLNCGKKHNFKCYEE